jgi:hypothetical protein
MATSKKPLNSQNPNAEPSTLDIFAAVVNGNGKAGMVAATHTIAYRCPMHLLPFIDSFADKSKKSRNFVISKLIEIGMNSTRDRLDQKALDDLDVRYSANYQKMIDKATNDGQTFEQFNEEM